MPLEPPNIDSSALVDSGFEPDNDLQFNNSYIIPVKQEIKQPENSDEAFKMWQQKPTKQHMGILLNSLEPDLAKITRQYTGREDPIALSYARTLAAQTMHKYDPTKAQLNTYLNRQLQPLIRWNAKRNRPVRIPDRVTAEAADLNRVERDLESSMGRTPTIEELADHSGISVKRIEYLRQSVPVVNHGTQAFGEDDGLPVYAEDAPVINQNNPNWTELVRNDLGDIDRLILDHSLGLKGAKVLSNKALAAKLKISPAAVTQRKARIQRFLDMQSELSPFN